MRVAVMMVLGARFTGKLFERNHAAMEFRAVFVLELDGGVGDVEVLAENVVQLDENAIALRGRNVGNGDGYGRPRRWTREPRRPDMARS